MEDKPSVQTEDNEVIPFTTTETIIPFPGEPLDQASMPYVGRWNQLVSTTNWEKGRIISDWREALVQTDAPATEYSDEAWARRVGGVTGQHVGRLRRVYQRFGQAYEEYPGLYWTHFHAALDWDDAELWLEGAVQSKWSVSQMRHQRWEAMGALDDDKPQPGDVVANETDEDFEPALNQDPVAKQTKSGGDGESHPLAEGPDFGDQPIGETGASIYTDDHLEESVDFVRPFENLAQLPDDLAEAFESFKLAILRHKADDWSEISMEDVLASLDALKELANAPAAH